MLEQVSVEDRATLVAALTHASEDSNTEIGFVVPAS